MGLTRIDYHASTPDVGERLTVTFDAGGLKIREDADVPADWAGWGRAQRVQWGRDWVDARLAGVTYRVADETEFPDVAAPAAAKDDYRNLPGWSTWTGAEAAAWIDANVTDLASAKVALRAMARAVTYLRDIGVER